MNEQSRGLILFALRELQSNIQYAPDQMIATLKDHFNVTVESGEILFDAINELAEAINFGDENV